MKYEYVIIGLTDCENDKFNHVLQKMPIEVRVALSTSAAYA